MEVKEIKKEVTITFDNYDIETLKYICEFYSMNLKHEFKENHSALELADDILNLKV